MLMRRANALSPDDPYIAADLAEIEMQISRDSLLIENAYRNLRRRFDVSPTQEFHKVRHKSRRVGRNRYVQGEAYNVYYIKVRFGNDLLKELQVERNRYTRLHKGDTLSLFVSEGALGIPVLKYNRVSKYEGGSN